MAKSDRKITQTKADVADRKDVERLFKEAIKTLGGLDVLANNAGIAGPTGHAEKIAAWDRCLAINITGNSIARGLLSPEAFSSLVKDRNMPTARLEKATDRSPECKADSTKCKNN